MFLYKKLVYKNCDGQTIQKLFLVQRAKTPLNVKTTEEKLANMPSSLYSFVKLAFAFSKISFSRISSCLKSETFFLSFLS